MGVKILRDSGKVSKKRRFIQKDHDDDPADQKGLDEQTIHGPDSDPEEAILRKGDITRLINRFR